MASEKTQASFDAVTSKLNNLSANDNDDNTKLVDDKEKDGAADPQPVGEAAAKVAEPAAKADEEGM